MNVPSSMLDRLGAVLSARLGARRREDGYVAVLVSILVPALFIALAATAVDTSRWYLEMERVQKAADAAALAGVPFLPQDMASARTRALEVAKRNGYDDALPEVVVRAEKGSRETQLRVTISVRVQNEFGQLIGVDSAGITRSAVADFTGPAPMGSPCNVFGTEPGSGSATAATPTGSAIGSVRPSNCPQDPELWASVEGPQTGKVQGDRYGTVNCESSGVDVCDGSRKNTEYPAGGEQKGERGYFWVIKVQKNMVNRPVNVQLYDPAFVRQGQFCDDDDNRSPRNPYLPAYSELDNNMNPYATSDGKVRYADVPSIPSDRKPAVPFCTGDSYAGSATGSTNPMTTTFMVREQTDSQDPMKAPVQKSTSGTPCAKQYGAFTSYPTYNNLKSGASGYNAELAQVFHNWTSLCTFTPAREGDYYLHVRTNKRFNFSSGQLVRQVPTGSSLDALSGLNGDSSPYGGGTNSFGIRAVTPAGYERGVSVSGWDRMPIYANSEAASTTFNLIRVLPGAAGQYLSFDFFDAGDAASTATVKVLLPTDAKRTNGMAITTPFPGSCKSWGGTAGGSAQAPGQTKADCTFTLTQSGGVSRNNGKVQTISIPIPPDYTCDATNFLNCWYRVQISFSSGSVHDVTTWDAEITGDPVRLIE